MAEHPNAVKMREAAAQFVAGDLEGFMATFSDDIVWRSGGSSALSGTYKGKDEVAGWFGQIREFAGDTIDVEPLDVLADDEHLTIFLHITAKRDDQVLDVEVANAFRVDPDGRWKESWYLPNDQAAWDRFFRDRYDPSPRSCRAWRSSASWRSWETRATERSPRVFSIRVRATSVDRRRLPVIASG
jgi:uncharacterized protein